MARLQVRFLVGKRDASGAPLFYWQPSSPLRAAGWKARPLVDGAGAPIRDAAAAAVAAEAINREVDAWRTQQAAEAAPKARAVPGSLAALVAAYQRSRFWRELADRTRRDYQAHLDRFLEWAGKARPARSVTPADVEAFYQAQLGRRRVRVGGKWQVHETPAKAAAAVAVVSALFMAGRQLGHVAANPAERPRISRERKRDPRLWSPAAVAAMVAAADQLGLHSLGTAILLNEWLGQREADVLALGPYQVEGGALRIRQNKTGRVVALPVHVVPHLVARLREDAARPGAVRSLRHLLVCELTGQAWNEHTFRHQLVAVREAAAKVLPECAGLRFMELRHTAVTRLHEAGVDALGIASITGHTPGSVLRILSDHYLVQTEKAAREAFRKRLLAELAPAPAAVEGAGT